MKDYRSEIDLVTYVKLNQLDGGSPLPLLFPFPFLLISQFGTDISSFMWLVVGNNA